MIWLGFLACGVWIYLLAGRGLFWLARERDDIGDLPQSMPAWPSVVAIVPARNEADVIAQTIASLLRQDYRGRFRVILVDDQSTDGTATRAQCVVPGSVGGTRLDIITGRARPSGWTGKVWAMQQGYESVDEDRPCYVLFTDADILHATDNLRRLVVRAETSKCVLVSLMAKLHCRSISEKLLVPAFVFFFDMLYPFAWSNMIGRGTAAAAGGCMLVRRDKFDEAGGLAAIRGAIIDDCSLARLMKQKGPIWLGLSERAQSIRPYDGIGDIWRMVARSAYAQLSYSPVLLLGTVLGMIVVYAAAPILALFASGMARICGLLAWLMMAIAYLPMIRFYRVAPLWSLTLPAAGLLYTVFTFDSALQFWRGKGGMWKGRAQAMA